MSCKIPAGDGALQVMEGTALAVRVIATQCSYCGGPLDPVVLSKVTDPVCPHCRHAVPTQQVPEAFSPAQQLLESMGPTLASLANAHISPVKVKRLSRVMLLITGVMVCLAVAVPLTLAWTLGGHILSGNTAASKLLGNGNQVSKTVTHQVELVLSGPAGAKVQIESFSGAGGANQAPTSVGPHSGEVVVTPTSWRFSASGPSYYVFYLHPDSSATALKDGTSSSKGIVTCTLLVDGVAVDSGKLDLTSPFSFALCQGGAS